jgi:hypothetical protein
VLCALCGEYQPNCLVNQLSIYQSTNLPIFQ